MTSWIRFATRRTSERDERVRSALAPLDLDPDPPMSSSDAGVVVFDDVSSEVVEVVRRHSRAGSVRVLAVSSSPDARADPWPLLDAGAADVIRWTDPAALHADVAARLSRWTEVDRMVRSPLVRSRLAGTSPTWLGVLRRIVEVARFSNESVLITGERGTGKTVTASVIHALDPRPDGGNELVTVDCRDLETASLEAELFGYERGTAEGAGPPPRGVPRLGAFGSAEGGTLFLHEASALPDATWAAVLRAVATGRYRPVGGEPRRASFRLICSVTEPVPEARAPSGVGEAPSQRSLTWSCRLPPLRERRDDIPAIAEQLLRRSGSDLANARLDPAVADFLGRRDYPGNVHDLQALIKKIAIRHVGSGPVTVGAIPTDERSASSSLDRDWRGEVFERAIRPAVEAGASLRAIGEAAKDAAIRVVAADEGGDIGRIARRLGTTPRAVVARAPDHATDRGSASRDRPSPVVALPESALLRGREGPASDT